MTATGPAPLPAHLDELREALAHWLAVRDRKGQRLVPGVSPWDLLTESERYRLSIQADVLISGPLAPLLSLVREQADALDAARRLLDEEDEHQREYPAWEITVLVPHEAGDAAFERVFDAVADTAYEAQPEERDWDVFVASNKHPSDVPTWRLRALLPNHGQPTDEEER